MRTSMGTLGLMAVLAAGCGGAPVESSRPQSVGDIQSMQRNADGNYDVICKGGKHELVTPTELANDNVCEKAAQPITISSMQLRSDRRYDVICQDGSLEVRSAEEIRRGEACRTKPSDRPIVVNFDDLQTGSLETTYQGIDWEKDWYVYQPMEGLYEAHSGNRYITNLHQKGQISFSFKTPVFFSGAWFSLDPNRNASVRFDVFDASGNLLASSKTLTQRLEPTFLSVEVAGVSKVTVVFSEDFAMDNITYSLEPTSSSN